MSDADIEKITQLENARFEAVVAGDFDAFAAVSHPELMYTHSSGITDTLDSYLRKCSDGYYVYQRIEHPISRITVVGDTALVLGEMHAELTVDGVGKELHTASLAVWVRDGGTWKFIAYQPTPLG